MGSWISQISTKEVWTIIPAKALSIVTNALKFNVASNSMYVGAI